MIAYLQLHSPLLKTLAVVSLLTFLLSLLLIPYLIAILPQDYFRSQNTSLKQSPIPRSFFSPLLFLIKNVLGILFFLAGIAMLFLPGQGILTIVIGLSLISFPGKDKLLQKLIQQKNVRHSLNWARNKMNKPPFLWE